MLIAQLSDPHIRLDDEASSPRWRGPPSASLALDAPDAVLLTGDIADTGDPEEYELAARLLAPIQAPVYTTAGQP